MRVVPLCAFVLAGVIATSAASVQTPPADPKFDPGRNAEKDLQGAMAEAKRSGRRVILDVGGEWCGWCHTLDRYFVEHPELRAMRDKYYVWLKVNYSPENRNEALLKRYGVPDAYPYLFVLDADGKLLQSQRTGPLEEGSSYNYAAMKGFLEKWRPALNAGREEELRSDDDDSVPAAMTSIPRRDLSR